jgi:uncharacterized protein with PCYCGC motif
MIYKLIAVAAAGLAGSFVVFAAADGWAQPDRRLQAAPPAQLAAATLPAKPHAGPLPPLPRVSFEPPRPAAVLQQVYDFAARHPEVLQYVPCYCGCERVGHTANHSCFVKSRAADGRVTEWDSHGMGCAVCIDVAREAMTLFNSGSKPAAIRAAIDKKYAPLFPSSTPTPRPR